MKYKLGRLFIGKRNRRRWKLALLFAKYLRKPRLPSRFDYERDALGCENFPVLDQDGVGACTVFSAATTQMRFEYAEQGPDRYPRFRFNDLLYTYDKIKQPGEGAYMSDLMAIWNQEGLRHRGCHLRRSWWQRLICKLAGRYDWYRIQSYAMVNPTVRDEVKAAIYLNGQIEIGILVTDGFLQACIEGWRPVTAKDADSQVLGGHAMNCVGYDAKGIYVNHTWEGGRKQLIEWGYCEAPSVYSCPMLDEAWAVVDARNDLLRKHFDIKRFLADVVGRRQEA